jgi:hypothetical protein
VVANYSDLHDADNGPWSEGDSLWISEFVTNYIASPCWGRSSDCSEFTMSERPCQECLLAGAQASSPRRALCWNG